MELTCEYPMISTLSALTSLNVSNAVLTEALLATVLFASLPIGFMILIDSILLSSLVFLASISEVLASILIVLVLLLVSNSVQTSV